MSHSKPTVEELEKQTQEAIDKLESPEEEQEDIEVEEKEEEVEEQEKEEEDDGEEEEKEEKEEKKEVEEKKEEKAPLTEKEQLKESTRESQILHLKNKKLQEVIDKTAEIAPPTEDEMKAEYPEWDEMTAVEKKLATENVHNNKRFAILEEVSKENKDIEAWNKKVDEFVEDPQTLIDNPQLERKIDKFKVFAGKPSRRGLDLEDLVLAFTGELAKSKPEIKKGAMFPRGGGADNKKENLKNGMISVADGALLMKTNYREYVRLSREGKIAVE